MTDKAEIQYLAEVAYPHGEFTSPGTIFVLREAFIKGFEQALVHNPQPDTSPKNNPPFTEDDAQVAAKHIFDTLTSLGSTDKVQRAVRDIIDGVAKGGHSGPKH